MKVIHIQQDTGHQYFCGAKHARGTWATFDFMLEAYFGHGGTLAAIKRGDKYDATPRGEPLRWCRKCVAIARRHKRCVKWQDESRTVTGVERVYETRWDGPTARREAA